MISAIKKKIKSNFLFIFIKSIKTSFHTVIEFKKNREDMNLFDLINLFIIRSIFGLTYFRNKIGYRKTDEIIDSSNFQYPIKKNKILKDLTERGYSDEFNINKSLGENLLTEILQNLKSSQIIFKNRNKEIKQLTFSNKLDVEQYLKSNQVHMIKSSIDLKKATLLAQIFKNDFFISLAKDYLNDDRVTIAPYFFISAANNITDVNPSNINPLLSLSAQEFHFDVDFKKFFKIFIYFSDVVDESNGCHIYIPNTHREKKTEYMITSRFNTAEIELKYTPKLFLGEAGTMFITDTFGIHKGTPVTKNTRLALIFEYGKGHFPFNKNCIYI